MSTFRFWSDTNQRLFEDACDEFDYPCTSNGYSVTVQDVPYLAELAHELGATEQSPTNVQKRQPKVSRPLARSRRA